MAGHDARLISRNGRMARYHYHTRWMAHWKQWNSIQATEYSEHCTHSLGSDKKSYMEQEGCLQIKNIISQKVQPVSIDMREENTSASRKTSDSIHNDLGLTLQVRQQTAEHAGSEKGKGVMDDSMVEKDKDTYIVAVSDKLYLHKLQDSSINSKNYETCHFLNSEGLSKDSHFPFYGINQKIWTNVHPNKGPEFEKMASKFVQSLLPRGKSKLGSHLTEFVAEEELRCVAESSSKSYQPEIEPLESVQGLHTLQSKFAASTSQPLVDRLKVQTASMRSPHFIHNERIPSSSDSMLDEQPRSTSLTIMPPLLWTFTGQSRATVSGIKDANKISDSIPSSWSTMKSGSMQVLENSWPGNLPFPSLVKKKVEYIQRSSGKSPLQVRHIESVETVKENGASLFEMLTVPVKSWSHEKQHGDPLPLICSDGNGNGDNGIENEIQTAMRKRSLRTDTNHVNTCKTRSPLGGMIPDRRQKDIMRMDLMKFHSSSASPINKEASSSTSNIELSSSRTKSIDEDHVLSHVHIQRSKVAGSTCIAESSTQGRSYNRWLKRLGHKTPNELATGIKRTKITNKPPGPELCGLSNQVYSCSVSTSDTTTKELPKTLGSSYVPSAEKMQHCIKRWCHGMPPLELQQILDAPLQCEPEKTDVLPDNLGKKKFPSIRAMAMMGKAMNNSQRGKFRRKGGLVVWNTGEF